MKRNENGNEIILLTFFQQFLKRKRHITYLQSYSIRSNYILLYKCQHNFLKSLNTNFQTKLFLENCIYKCVIQKNGIHKTTSIILFW